MRTLLGSQQHAWVEATCVSKGRLGSMFGTTSDLDKGLSKTCRSTIRLTERAQLTSLKVCEVTDQGKLQQGQLEAVFRQLLLVQTVQLYRSV